MGIVYAAALKPSKMELVAAWLPAQEWFEGGAPEPVRLGSFRFDDPAGEVGIETHIVGAGGKVYQVPLTYRGAPLDGAEKFLVGTMEHSVLGSRWVYDAAGDPVYTAELAAALLAAKPQAVEYKEVDGAVQTLPHTAVLSCARPSDAGMPDAVLPDLRLGAAAPAGGITTIPAGPLSLEIQRVLDAGATAAAPFLAVTRAGQDVPVVIATTTRA